MMLTHFELFFLILIIMSARFKEKWEGREEEEREYFLEDHRHEEQQEAIRDHIVSSVCLTCGQSTSNYDCRLWTPFS